MIKKYLLYILRWQASTFILAPVLVIFGSYNPWIAAAIANLIGALIFFWVDKYIFKVSVYYPLWEIKEDITCVDCKIKSKGYRLVKTKNYDKLADKLPEFRCDLCSEKKLKELKERGIKI